LIFGAFNSEHGLNGDDGRIAMLAINQTVVHDR
jgi:hypothetical protein